MLEWIWIALGGAGLVFTLRKLFQNLILWDRFRYQPVDRPLTRSQPAGESSPQPTPQPRPTVEPTPQPAPRQNGETGPMIYYANDPHGQADREYRFNYKRVNGSWRAYILKMPNLRGREASGVVTHRLFDGRNPYVCWNCAVEKLEDMQTISRVWADNIQEYIATGKRFG